MTIFIGLTLLTVGIVVAVFGLKLATHDQYEFNHNHRVSNSLKHAVLGEMNQAASRSKDEVSRGFTVDVRTGEIAPCSQLSKESIS